ncbi:heavy metal translocating P-type ATPase [Conchiformibius steedae]
MCSAMTDHDSCFHCGLPVPEQLDLSVTYQSQPRRVCCAGCQAVAQSIIDAGLDNYYRHRTAQAQQVALPPPELLEQLKLYDLPEVQQGFVATRPDQCREAVLMFGGMTCAACAWLIEQKLLRLSGMEKVELNYGSGRARVVWNDDVLKLSQVMLAVRETGYSAEPYDAEKRDTAAQKQRRGMLIRIAVAGLASMQTMMLALPTYLDENIETSFVQVLHWGAFVMVLPAMFYAATPFYQGAWRDLKNRRSGMDTPVALALTLTFAAGVYALFSQAGQGMYFESLAMFVFFLLVGRFMEQSTRHKAGDAAERLVRLVPAFCHRLPDYPHSRRSEEAAVAALQSGDILLIRAGETVPVDGEVLAGESETDEAMLTGENLPVAKRTGDKVTAGTLNTAAELIVRAEQTGAHTRLAHIVRLLDRALSQKPRLAEMAQRYASGFTLSLIVMAVPTFLGWWWYADAGTALWVTVSLLVITCPCALSLATPAALAASTARLAKSGVLLTRGHVLETLPAITDVVFDKTGTLTRAAFRITESHFAESANANLATAAAQALEQHSEHPIARAFALLPAPACTVNVNGSVQNRVGYGVSARLQIQGEENQWHLGRADFVAQIPLPAAWQQADESGTAIFLSKDGQWQAMFVLEDQIRSDAESVLAQLHAQGLHTHLLSGDRRAAVAAAAEQTGMGAFRAEATPEDKLAYVHDLQAQEKRVLMLGDGINDAPVLAVADVSVAVAGSADVARDGADVLLLQDDLSLLPQLLHQAQRTQRIIRQNLWWATAYNLLVVPLAVCGWVKPWGAALGMSASSLLVVWNALRLRKGGKNT